MLSSILGRGSVYQKSVPPLIIKKSTWSINDWENTLDRIRVTKGLSVISISGNLPEVEETIEFLIGPSLRLLELVNTGINDECLLNMTSALISAPMLTILNLSGNNIGTEGTIHLANALSQNIVLEHLSIADNNIGDPGLSAIAKCLTINLTLQTLILCGNDFGEESLLELAEVLQYSSLCAIDLTRMELTSKVLGNLRTARNMNEILKLVWVDSIDYDFQGDLIKYLLSQSGRLEELFEEVQIGMRPERCGRLDRYNIQILNYDENLQGNDCIRYLFDNLAGGLSNEIQSKISILLLFKRNDLQNSVMFQKVDEIIPDSKAFCYNSLYCTLENPMVRQEFMKGVVDTDDDKSVIPISSAKPPKKKRSFQLFNQKTAKRGDRGYSSQNNPKINKKKKKKKRGSFFSGKRKTESGRSDIHNSLTTLLVTDSDHSFEAGSVATLPGNNSSALLNPAKTERDKPHVKVHGFSATEFTTEFKKIQEGAETIVQLYYSTELLPYMQKIIAGPTSLVFVFSYKQFLTSPEKLESNIVQSVNVLKHLSPKVLFAVTTVRKQKYELVELNTFIKKIERSLRIDIFRTGGQCVFHLVDDNALISEGLQQEPFSTKARYHNANRINFPSISYYRALETQVSDHNVRLPAVKIFNRHQTLQQLEDTGLVLTRNLITIIKPMWLLEIVRSLLDIAGLEDRFSKMPVQQQELFQFQRECILSVGMVNDLLKQSSDDKLGNTESALFRNLLEMYGLLAGYSFNSREEKYILFLRMPSQWKPEASHSIRYNLVFTFKNQLPPFLFETLTTAVLHKVNASGCEIKATYKKMPKNKKKRKLWSKLISNTIIRSRNDSIDLKNQRVHIRFRSRNRKTIRVAINNKTYVKNILGFVNDLLDDLNANVFNGILILETLHLVSYDVNGNKETNSIDELKAKHEFPFDTRQGKLTNNASPDASSSSFNEINKSTKKPIENTGFLQQLLLEE